MPDESTWGGVLRRITTSSAVNPTMFVSIAGLLLGPVGFSVAPAEYSWVFVVVILAPLFIFLGQVILFSLKDPDRLQNERHVEQKMLINHGISIKRDGRVIDMPLPKDAPITPNPQALGDQP